MTTTSRKLTLNEQIILDYLMRQSGMTQIKIARINKLNSSTMVHRVCAGKYNVTPKIREWFMKSGIDLDSIMNPKPYTRKKKYGRVLTNTEQLKLKYRMLQLGISQAQIARNCYTSVSIINAVCCGKYKVTDLIKKHFALSGIDLEEVMSDD